MQDKKFDKFKLIAIILNFLQSYVGWKQETLYQAVALVDRVLQVWIIPVEKVQLLGLVAFLIASKLEEEKPAVVSVDHEQ